MLSTDTTPFYFSSHVEQFQSSMLSFSVKIHLCSLLVSSIIHSAASFSRLWFPTCLHSAIMGPSPEQWLLPELSNPHFKAEWGLGLRAGRILAVFSYVFLKRDKWYQGHQRVDSRAIKLWNAYTLSFYMCFPTWICACISSKQGPRKLDDLLYMVQKVRLGLTITYGMCIFVRYLVFILRHGSVQLLFGLDFSHYFSFQIM